MERGGVDGARWGWKEEVRRDGVGRDGKGWDGMGCEGKGRDGTGWQRNGREGTGWERMGKEGKGRDGTARQGEGVPSLTTLPTLVVREIQSGMEATSSSWQRVAQKDWQLNLTRSYSVPIHSACELSGVGWGWMGWGRVGLERIGLEED